MLFFTVTDAVLHNVALKRPSYQVSTLADEFGAHNASLANDGSRQTNYEDRVNGCARSLRETNPWWVVDLGVETLVAQVNLTNRGDDAGSDLYLTIYYFINVVSNTMNVRSRITSHCILFYDRMSSLVYHIPFRVTHYSDNGNPPSVHFCR